MSALAASSISVPANASEPVLDFSLPNKNSDEAEPKIEGNLYEVSTETIPSPLAVPAAKIPLGHSDMVQPDVSKPDWLLASLPSLTVNQSVENRIPRQAANDRQAIAPSQTKRDRPVVLSFALQSATETASDQSNPSASTGSAETDETATNSLESDQPSNPSQKLDSLPPNWFEGGSNAPIARVIGVAEGTRTSDGLTTPAYFGHIDPGNRAWNLGSFSYQHGAKTPNEADEKQSQRLKEQAEILFQKATAHQLTLTLTETLNGLDLANQAPLAALGHKGYIDRLQQAHQMGLSGDEAILWARTHSFLDPDTQRWNAPGLGNTIDSISHDQKRRMRAIATALTHLSLDSPSKPQSLANQTETSTHEQSESVIDQILTLDLPD